jgi:hypothetical protein
MGKNGNSILNLRIKSDEKFEEKFKKIKEELGLNSNAEVVRFLVHKYYRELIQRGSLLAILPIKLMVKVSDALDAIIPETFALDVTGASLEAMELLGGIALSF